MAERREFRYKQVDVFTKQVTLGNPVAVVIADEQTTRAEMLRIANWLNLSETVFVTEISDAASYRIKIFTPTGELPFAGHPSLGCLHALLEWGLVDENMEKFTQHCGVGDIQLYIKNDIYKGRHLNLVSPPYSHRKISEPSLRLLRECLPGINPNEEPLVIDVGPHWLVTRLNHYQMHLYKPQIQAITQLSRQENLTGLCLFAVIENPKSVYTRSFAPIMGVNEDPVCGGGNISVAAYLATCNQIHELNNAYTAHQGHEMARNGVLHLYYDADSHDIHLGGNCVTAIDGRFYF